MIYNVKLYTAERNLARRQLLVWNKNDGMEVLPVRSQVKLPDLGTLYANVYSIVQLLCLSEFSRNLFPHRIFGFSMILMVFPQKMSISSEIAIWSTTLIDEGRSRRSVAREYNLAESHASS